MPATKAIRLALQRSLAPGAWDGIATVDHLDQKFERGEVIITLKLSFIFGAEIEMVRDLMERLETGARFRIVEMGTEFIRECELMWFATKGIDASRAVAVLKAVEQEA